MFLLKRRMYLEFAKILEDSVKIHKRSCALIQEIPCTDCRAGTLGSVPGIMCPLNFSCSNTQAATIVGPKYLFEALTPLVKPN